jgi:hypothetical protein
MSIDRRLTTMNALKTSTLGIALCASLFAADSPSWAACGDATLDQEVASLRQDLDRRGVWANAYMPHGTGLYASVSADEILTASLRLYTRQVLDRGGWVNPYVGGNQGYDAGNALLAVRQGEGVTTLARAPARIMAPAVIAAFR